MRPGTFIIDYDMCQIGNNGRNSSSNYIASLRVDMLKTLCPLRLTDNSCLLCFNMLYFEISNIPAAFWAEAACNALALT